jgi:Uma2 family endonuclease
MAAEPSTLLTYEDFLALPDDGVRREIIDGEVVVTPSPNVRHQDLAGYIFNALYNHIRAHGGGRVFIAPLDVRLSEHDIVEPDVLFVASERTRIIEKNYLLGTPTLCVEVVSDPRTDRVRKRELYARTGVRTYWIVDPEADRVEVHRLEGTRYGKPEILETGDTLTLMELPGFSIDVAELFRVQ